VVAALPEIRSLPLGADPLNRGGNFLDLFGSRLEHLCGGGGGDFQKRAALLRSGDDSAVAVVAHVEIMHGVSVRTGDALLTLLLLALVVTVRRVDDDVLNDLGLRGGILATEHDVSP
jgi:hypothetical protein